MVFKSLYRSVDMVNSISKAILVNQLVEERDRVLLSISGGQDSICLLVLFNQLYAQMGLHLGLFWCQHLWQTDSFSLMRQISKISCLFQFDSYFAIPSKFVPSELLARNWRHNCSYRISLFYNYSKISLAHSANDKAETILLNLMRGTGATGLSPLQWTKLIPEKSIQKKEHILEYSRYQFYNFFWSPFCFDRVKEQRKRNGIVLGEIEDVHHAFYHPLTTFCSQLLRCNKKWLARPIVTSFRSCVLQVFYFEHYEYLPPPRSQWLKEKNFRAFLKKDLFLYHLLTTFGNQWSENSFAINKSSNSINFTLSNFSLTLTNPTSGVILALIPLASLGIDEVGESWEIENFKYQLYNVGESKNSKLLKDKNFEEIYQVEMCPKNSIDEFCKINSFSIDLKSKIITKWIWNKFMTNPRACVADPDKIAFLQIFSFFDFEEIYQVENSNHLQNGCLPCSSVPWVVETAFLKKRRKKFELKSESEMIVKSVKETKAKKWFSFVSYTFFKSCSISFEQI